VRDGLSATIGAGNKVIDINGRSFLAGWNRHSRAADEAGPLGPSASFTQHDGCPANCTSVATDRPILEGFAMSSRPARKKVFL